MGKRDRAWRHSLAWRPLRDGRQPLQPSAEPAMVLLGLDSWAGLGLRIWGQGRGNVRV